MSQASIHAAYVVEFNAKNGAIVQPEFVGRFAPNGQEITKAFYAANEADAVTGTVFTTNGAQTARVIADGRCVEKSIDSRGNALYAVFPSLDAQRAYKKPMGFNEFFERW